MQFETSQHKKIPPLNDAINLYIGVILAGFDPLVQLEEPVSHEMLRDEGDEERTKCRIRKFRIQQLERQHLIQGSKSAHAKLDTFNVM